MSDAEAAFLAREATGLSQRAFAHLIGAHKATVAEWESGRGRLSRLTRSLLRLVEADPELAFEVLHGRNLPVQGERSKPCACMARAWVRRAHRSPSPSALRARCVD